MNPDINSNPLLKSIDFGFEVEAFLSGDIGKYLVKRAEDEIEAAVEQMKRISPDNAAGIRALQHKIHVAEDIQYWLAEAIQSGLNAQQELHDQGD